MKYNKNFAKLMSDNTPEWGPIPLIVVPHHQEEGIDPYDTTERKLRPSAAEFRQMEYLPVIRNPPSDPTPEGYHYEETGYAYSQDGESIVCRYELVADPAKPIMSDALAGESFISAETLHELIDASKKMWTCLGGQIP